MGASAALTVPSLLAARAAAEPGRVAILLAGGRSLTFQEWDERAGAVARGLLARGVARGDRVGLLFEDGDWIEFAVACCGVQRAGAAAVPLSLRLAPAQVRDLLGHCAVSAVLHGAGVDAPVLDAWAATPPDVQEGGRAALDVRVQPGDLAQVLYTSGTTGTPKGVAASHANLTTGFEAAPRRRPLAHSERFLHAFPIGTNAAQTMLLNALVARPAALVPARFEPDGFCALIEAHRVGTVFLVPATAIALLNARAPGRHDVSSVLLLGSTAAALPPAIALALSAAFPAATIVNTYTSTEAAPAQTTMVFDPDRPASVGRPARPDDLLIAGPDGEPLPAGEVGEVWLRSPAPPRAYYRDPDASARVFTRGWVRMGDLGRLDAGGHLHLVDREADVVKSGGLKVSTLQVEAACYEHPAVAEAAAVGLPHPVMGTVMAAAVVLRSPATPDELRAFLGTRLASHERPARVAVVESLPRNAAGKVLKRELRELLAAPGPFPGPPPGSATEVALARLWSRVLDVDVARVAAGDDFFALGGDSLRASQLATAASETFGVAVSASLAFDVPVLARQAELIDAAPRPAPRPAAAGEPGGVVLSSQQLSFFGWMAVTRKERHPAPVGVSIRVRDRLDHALLRRSVEEIVRRHEPLRTTLVRSRGTRVGVLLPDCPLEFVSTAAASEEEAHPIAMGARGRQFDVATGPLVRVLAVRLGPEDHLLVIAVSHLVFDGASMGILLRELGVVYSALRLGRPNPLPPLPMRCSDLCAWAREQWPATREFWLRALDGAPPGIDPFPGRRPVERFTRASITRRIDAGTARGLRAGARSHAATLFMVMAACWVATLAEWSGTADVVVLTPAPGRTRPGSEALIGCLLQSLLARVDAGGDPSFLELLARVRSTMLAALDHQYHPYEEFRLRIPHAAWLRYESWGGGPHFPGLESEPYELPHEVVAEDWEIPGGDRSVPELAVLEQQDGSLSVWVVFNVHAFDRPVVERLAGVFVRHVERAQEELAE